MRSIESLVVLDSTRGPSWAHERLNNPGKEVTFSVKTTLRRVLGGQLFQRVSQKPGVITSSFGFFWTVRRLYKSEAYLPRGWDRLRDRQYLLWVLVKFGYFWLCPDHLKFLQIWLRRAWLQKISCRPVSLTRFPSRDSISRKKEGIHIIKHIIEIGPFIFVFFVQRTLLVHVYDAYSSFVTVRVRLQNGKL